MMQLLVQILYQRSEIILLRALPAQVVQVFSSFFNGWPQCGQ
jgi:hypothetical protein